MFSILHVTVSAGWNDIVFGVKRLCPVPVLPFSLIHHAVIRLHVHLILVLLRPGMAYPATGGFSCLGHGKAVPRMASVTSILCNGVTRQTCGCLLSRLFHLTPLVY